MASLVKSDIIKERDGFEESYTVHGSGFDDMVATKVGSKWVLQLEVWGKMDKNHL